MKRWGAILITLLAIAAGAQQQQRGTNQQGQSQSGRNQQGQAQQGTNTSTVTTGGSSVTESIPRQAPLAYAPDAIATVPCFKTLSAGASSPVGALGFGAGKIDKGCDDRETARAFYNMGNPTAAGRILCDTPAAKRAGLRLEDCLALVPRNEPSQAAIVTPTPAAPQQVPSQIIVPAPQVTIQVPPFPASALDNKANVVVPVAHRAKSKPCKQVEK